MKILNKYLYIFLALGFLSLYGMEEQDTNAESRENAQIEPDPKRIKLPDEPQQKAKELLQEEAVMSLKMICANRLASLISSGDLIKEDAYSILPEGLPELVEQICTFNTYMDDSYIAFKDEEEAEQASKLIKENKKLFMTLLESYPKCAELLLAGLDEFFAYYIDEDSIKIYQATGWYCNDAPFRLINVMLKVALDLYDHDLLKQTYKNVDKLIKAFLSYAIEFNSIHSLRLFLALDFLPKESRKFILKLFEEACGYNCSAMTLKLLNEKISITKKEFGRLLKKTHILGDVARADSDMLEYLFELMENFNIDLKPIINRLYNEETLLHRAAKKGHIDVVNFLLEKGADPELEDMSLFNVLTATQLQYCELAAIFDSSKLSDEETKRELEQIDAVIKILEPLIKKPESKFTEFLNNSFGI